MDYKYCSACDTNKPVSEFNKNKTKKDGLQSRCRECNKKILKQWYEANREHKQEYYIENKERIKETQKRYVLNNREKFDEYQRRYRRQNRDKMKARQRVYYSKNPNANRRYKALRRARERSAEGTYSEAEANVLLSMYNTCPACGEGFTEDAKPTLDHIVPITRNGTNYITNLMPLCKRCNSSKNAKTPEEWKPKGHEYLKQVELARTITSKIIKEI